MSERTYDYIDEFRKSVRERIDKRETERELSELKRLIEKYREEVKVILESL